jgi:hypothetical protein
MNEDLGYIVVRPSGEDQFVAHSVLFPEVKAEAASESEAVEKVRRSLDEFLAASKLIKVSRRSGNPWLDAFGSAADDPDFEVYLDEIRKARLAADEE